MLSLALVSEGAQEVLDVGTGTGTGTENSEVSLRMNANVLSSH